MKFQKDHNGNSIIPAMYFTEIMSYAMAQIFRMQQHLNSETSWMWLHKSFSMYNIAVALENATLATHKLNEFQAEMQNFDKEFKIFSEFGATWIFDFQVTKRRRKMEVDSYKNTDSISAFCSHRNTQESDAMSGSWNSETVHDNVLSEVMAREDEEMNREPELASAKPKKIKWSEHSKIVQMSLLASTTQIKPISVPALLLKICARYGKCSSFFRVNGTEDQIFGADFGSFIIYYHSARYTFIKFERSKNMYEFYGLHDDEFFGQTPDFYLAMAMWSMMHVSTSYKFDFSDSILYAVGTNVKYEMYASGFYKKYYDKKLQATGSYYIDHRNIPHFS
jgi:hypothetical protein